MLRLAAPAVAAQLINVLYNIVDRIYIGHIAVVGKTALTGVGVTFPILTLISAFSAFAGMGGAPLASIRLGAGDRKGAEAILGSAVSMLVTMALVLTVGFSVFQRPLLLAFGASADTIGYATDYLTIYLLGTIFVQLSLGLNTFISAQGKAMPAMCSVLIGAVLNILLDPLFIFVFGMGVRGAALATILSQAVSAVWVVGFLCSDRSGLHICREHLGFRPRVMGKIAALGVAPFIMQSTESLVTVVLNVGAQKYGGDLYVASITILLQEARPKIALHIPLCTESVAPGLGGANERYHHFDVHLCFDLCVWYHMSFCLSCVLLTVRSVCGTLGIHILQSISFLASTRIMPCNRVGGSSTH